MRQLALIALWLALAAPSPLEDAIGKNRYPVAIAGEKLAGDGAAVLRTALAGAHFVMLGEDHGIAQIPRFGAALCNELHFHHLALEVGASVAPELTEIAHAKAPAARAAAFVKRFPETIAFYDWKEELEMLAECSKASSGAPLDVWGLDQELMGAPVFVLQKILDTKPGPIAKAAIEALVREDAADHAAAAKTGDFGKLFLIATEAAKLDAAASALAKDGSPDAQAMFASLLESRAIYLGQSGPDPYASNRRRARLMKRTLLDHIGAAVKADKEFPHVLVKLGAWHLYRGLNPLHSSEVGNMIAEAAEAHGVEAVNVLVLGVKGQQLHVTGVARAPTAVPLDLAGDKDSELKFLAPFFAATDAHGWTLFDLRALRSGFRKLGPVDPELERLVFGYDFMVLIPDPKPAHAEGR